MKTARLAALLALAPLCGCGVETAGTAATSAEIKRREVQAGQQNLEQARQKIEQATQQAAERAARPDGDK